VRKTFSKSFSIELWRDVRLFCLWLAATIMGHEASQFAPLDPDLEDENLLVDLIPLLVSEIIADERAPPQAQCTSILTGRGYVEELFAKDRQCGCHVRLIDLHCEG
jgi:hypothetical protein